MRYIFLIFLSLSLPAIAQDTATPSQENLKPPAEKENIEKPIPPCDPKAETRLPEFN